MENTSSAWLRPKTTRRYIHPPKAEHMYTIWAEGKIIFGEIIQCIDWRSYRTLECSGLWLVHGEKDEQFDFHSAENRLPENGTPFHGLTHRSGDLCVDIDTFCDIDRKPTCFIRLRLTNTGSSPVREPLALLLRSGKEKELVFATPDEYDSYAPDVNVWKNAPVTWRAISTGARTVLVDEYVFLSACGMPVNWDDKAGALRFEAELAAGETAELYLSFGKGEVLPFDYGQEKARAQSFWNRELARIDRLPESIRNNPDRLRMIQNLAVHMMQCFCYQVGKNNLLPRQGGMQRLIWPWEALYGMAALGRIGDFSDYLEPVLSFYFDELQAPDGEVRPAGEGWGSITSCALYSFARYSLDVCGRFYYRYRDNAMAAFDWVKRTRASSASMEGCIAGLFPPMRGNDWGQEFQGWMTTDIINIECLEALADAAERFNDPRAAEIRAEVNDHLSVMRSIMHRFEVEAGDSDQLRIPLKPDGDDEQLLREFYPYLTVSQFTAMGVVTDENVQRVMNYCVASGIYFNGLYGHMPYEDGNIHIWYTSVPDYYWFLTWMRLGRRELAEDIIRCQIRYSMTDEYYMVERYADNDPYYVPWSPNSSANGRLISMLLDFYGDQA